LAPKNIVVTAFSLLFNTLLPLFPIKPQVHLELLELHSPGYRLDEKTNEINHLRAEQQEYQEMEGGDCSSSMDELLSIHRWSRSTF
jgi:hypothetical protein